jgi:glutamate/tyrosine decarboxylase-like PLP-dependent enzyme
MADFPYTDRYLVHRALPEHGRPRAEILTELAEMAQREDAAWETGKCSGTMYCGDHDHYDFLNDAFGLFSHVNTLQRDLCPSATKFEGEILAMALDLFHANAVTDGDPVGLLTTGGTGSILHAMLAYREYGAQHRGITRPNVVKPESAHPAFSKACHLLGIELRIAPINFETMQVDVEAVERLMDEQTVCLIGSASNYGWGTIDPISELGQLAIKFGGGGFHKEERLTGYGWHDLIQM